MLKTKKDIDYSKELKFYMKSLNMIFYYVKNSYLICAHGLILLKHKIIKLNESYCELYNNKPLTPKAHLLFHHLYPFAQYHNTIGLFNRFI